MTIDRRISPAAIGAACMLLTTTTGCGPQYFSLTTEYVRTVPPGDEAEVDVSPSAAGVIARVDTIAIRPDPSCRDLSASTSVGAETPSEQLLRLRCGTTMAYLERAFASNGYRVIYWSAIDRIAEERRAQLEQTRIERVHAAENSGSAVLASPSPRGDLLPERVAAELGVDAIISANAIEFTFLSQTASATWQRSYRLATRSGSELGEANVPANLADALDGYLLEQERQLSAEQVPAVVFDVSAQHLDTHESFFFFRTAVALAPEETVRRRYFVACAQRGLTDDDAYYVCSPATAQARGADGRPPRAGSTATMTVQGEPSNPSMAIWSSLLEEGARQLASRFRAGTPTSSASVRTTDVVTNPSGTTSTSQPREGTP